MILHYTNNSRIPLMWHKKLKLFTIEASDLPNYGESCNPYVHDNITIHVLASGNSKIFRKYSVVRDADNDVLYWLYRDIDGDGFTLHVYND